MDISCCCHLMAVLILTFHFSSPRGVRHWWKRDGIKVNMMKKHLLMYTQKHKHTSRNLPDIKFWNWCRKTHWDQSIYGSLTTSCPSDVFNLTSLSFQVADFFP